MANKVTREWLWKNDWYSWIIDKYYLPSGQKYTFKSYEYLIDIAKRKWVPGDELFGMKSAQCRFSELAIAWCFWLLERGLLEFNGLGYFFPSKTHLDDHVKSRVFPIISLPQFRPKVSGANLSHIRYNNIPWLFRSSNPRAFKSFPAGACVADEFDEFEDPIKVIPKLEARFYASDWGWIFGLSTPTHPDMGIDKAVSLSNQYNWFVECPKCSKKFSPLQEVIINQFENCVVWIDDATAGFLCPFCKEPVQTPGLPGKWELTDKKPNQKYSYSISKLFLKRTNLAGLLTSYEDALNLQEFYNSDLGLPYAPANSRLKRSSLRDVAIGETECAAYSDKTTWIGVDVGKPCHYMVGLPGEDGTKKVIAYGTCKIEKLSEVISKYRCKTMVIDLRPYENTVKEFIKGKRGFYGCDFNTGNQVDWYTIVKSDVTIRGLSSKIVKAERTQSCDKIIEQIAVRKKMIFPACTKGDENFIKQMCSPMRMDKTDKKTEEIRSYYKSSSKKDHYFFAAVYLNLAFNLRKGSFARVTGLIL